MTIVKMPTEYWLPRDPRDGEPAIEMRFHDDWWHSIFEMPEGYQVVLGPIGIDLGKFDTLGEAVARAESNARERALNTLASAQTDIRRAAMVLGVLSAAKNEKEA